MSCCWCNGDHPATCCPEKIGIQEALNILGPVRAIRAADQFQTDPKRQMYWLDGRIVDHRPVRKEAMKLKRKRNANTS
jgi:hypothetical protein